MSVLRNMTFLALEHISVLRNMMWRGGVFVFGWGGWKERVRKKTERVRKKTESRQKGGKKALLVRKKKFGQKKKKATDDYSGRQRRQAKESKRRTDRRKTGNKLIGDERNSLTQLQKLVFLGEAGPLPFVQKGTFVMTIPALRAT